MCLIMHPIIIIAQQWTKNAQKRIYTESNKIYYSKSTTLWSTIFKPCWAYWDEYYFVAQKPYLTSSSQKNNDSQ